MSFLVDEDDALRRKLMGITVSDQMSDRAGTPRPVPVRFGQPDQEIAAQNYPYIVIDMIDVARDTQREMRGLTNVPYLAPDVMIPETDFLVDIPIPVNIDYQISTYARNPRHDREILSQLLTTKLPVRFGVLEIGTGKFDEDENPLTTMRRLDVLDVAKRDSVEQAKRLFVNAITVRVSSEVSQGTYRTLYKVLDVQVHNPDSSRQGGTSRAPYFTGLGELNITP